MISKIVKHLNWQIAWYLQQYRIDKKFGIETRERETLYLEGIDPEKAQGAEWYEPVKWRVFSEIMANTPIEYSDYTFIDLGSGKGRALVFATQYAFNRSIGVELSEHLHDIAVSNIQSFEAKRGQKSNIELTCCDVREFEFPPGNLVFWMYNPFFGEVMLRFLSNLAEHCATTGNEAYLCYYMPQCREEIESRGDFAQVLHGTVRKYSIYRFDHPHTLMQSGERISATE
jgi:predicted RNA methylase